MAELTKIEHLSGKFPQRLLALASVIGRIDSFLEDQNVEPLSTLPVSFDLGVNRRTSIFHASSIGHSSGKSLCGKYPLGCSRMLFYDYTGAPAEGAWDPRMRKLLDTGSAIHAQLQGYLEVIAANSDGAESFTPEAEIDPNENEVGQKMDTSGHTDGIYTVVVPGDKVRFGIEIKTINEAGYQKTRGPHPEHIMQGTIYQKCLDLPLMVFLYYNKNDSSVAEFVHVFDPERWDAIVRKLNKVRECAFLDAPPEQETGWHCSNCKYKVICNPPSRRGARSAKSASAFRTQKRSG